MSRNQLENGNGHRHFLDASEGMNTIPDILRTKLIDTLLSSEKHSIETESELAIIRDALNFFYQNPLSDVYNAVWLEEGKRVGCITIQENGKVYVQHDTHDKEKIRSKRKLLQDLTTPIFENAQKNVVDIVDQLAFQAESMVPHLLHLPREARISVIDLSINLAGYRGLVHESK